jgi:hypothetical protein
VGHAGEGELLRCWAAADPEKAVEVDTDGGGGLGVERVGHVDPGADASDVCQTRDEGEREGGSARALGSGKFGDGPDGKAAAKGIVEGGDAGRGSGADDAGGGSERGGDAVREGSFDLLAEQLGGRHGGGQDFFVFALSSPIGGAAARGEIQIHSCGKPVG